jgi:hypothetical protein
MRAGNALAGYRYLFENGLAVEIEADRKVFAWDGTFKPAVSPKKNEIRAFLVGNDGLTLVKRITLPKFHTLHKVSSNPDWLWEKLEWTGGLGWLRDKRRDFYWKISSWQRMESLFSLVFSTKVLTMSSSNDGIDVIFGKTLPLFRFYGNVIVFQDVPQCGLEKMPMMDNVLNLRAVVGFGIWGAFVKAFTRYLDTFSFLRKLRG